MEVFDLVSIQRQAAECKSPRVLFDLWEQACRKYDRGQIGKHHLQELKDIIWPKLQLLSGIKRSIEACYASTSVAAHRASAGKQVVHTLAL